MQCSRSASSHSHPDSALRRFEFLNVVFLKRPAHRQQRNKFKALAPQHFECCVLLLLRQCRTDGLATPASLGAKRRQGGGHLPPLSVKDDLDFAVRLRSPISDPAYTAQLALMDDGDSVTKRFRIRENVS